MASFKDYYAILNVSRYATTTDIKAAYKRRCMEWHPDRNPGINTTGAMQALNEAKQILLNSAAREKYNLEYEKHKGTKATQQPRHSYTTEHQARRYKERYVRLKTRVEAFGAQEPFLYAEYNKQAKMKSNSELLAQLANWDCYQKEYIDISIMELHENRAYSVDSIYQKIKVKPKAPTGESNTDPDRWIWFVLWLILVSLLKALA